MKKYLLLTTAFVLMSGSALAEETALPTSGTCGTDCTWSYNESTKTIKITGNESGTGVMSEFEYTDSTAVHTTAEWDGYKEIAENIVISGIKTLGSMAFLGFLVKHVEMDDYVTSIHTAVFAGCYILEDIKLSQNLQQVGGSAFLRIGENVEGGMPSLVFPEKVVISDLRAINVDTLVMPSALAAENIKETLFSGDYELWRERVSVKTMYCTGEQMAACSAALQDARIDIEPTRYEKTSDGVLVYDKKGNAVSKYKDIDALGAKEVAETYKYDSAGHLVGIFDGTGQRTWGKKIYTVEEAMEATKNGDKFHVYLTYK